MPTGMGRERVGQPMPEFAMPDAEAPLSSAVDARDERRPEGHAIPPEPTTTPEPPRLERPRGDRRHLLAAALAGLLVGMLVPGGIAAAEQVAAQARADGLRATASSYLAAIAAGRSDEATALVPLAVRSAPADARSAPAAVLAAAQRIREADVPFVHAEDSTGLAVVRYRLGDRVVTRTLEARLVEGRWQFDGSLAEPVVVQRVDGGTASIAGTPMTGAVVHLYPAVYRFDAFTHELVEFGGNAFEVDGDPSTRTEAVAGARIVPAVHDRVVQVALSAATACQRQDGCVLAPDAAVRVPAGATLLGPASETGPIDVAVPLEAVVAGAERWTEMRVRVGVDERGDPTGWLCTAPGAPGGALGPCP